MEITWKDCFDALDGREGEWADSVRHYLSATHVVPDWFMPHFERAARREYKFAVRHNGQTIDLWSCSAEQAVNVIRFNLYERTPERDLPPFAVMAYMPNIASVAARIVASERARHKPTATPAKINLLAQRLMRFAR